MDVLTHRIFKRGINELSMFCVVFSLFIYGLFSECCDGNAVFVKDYSTDLLFPLIMKWNNEALVFIHLRLLDVFIYYFSN